MKATFENSVDVLVKAYLNGTLASGHCEACACGNLVAAANGYKIIMAGDDAIWDSPQGVINGAWVNVCYTDFRQPQKIELHRYRDQARFEIDSTGYSVKHFAMIEEAFERGHNKMNWKFWQKPDRMFNGLLAVVDALADIHGVDLTVKQSAVGRFEEIHATR